MKNKIVIGNWKMNTNFEEAKQLITDLNAENTQELKCILLVPSIYIITLQNIAQPAISIGAQNLSSFDQGAFTGEISADMLQSIQVKYVCIGHSERRNHFQENNETILQKVKQALKNNIIPILCCGENLEVRQQGGYLSFVQKQIEFVMKSLSQEEFKKLIIAYEPIWAIGTGHTASASQAQEVHQYIRKIIADQYSPTVANDTTILYGGSVKATNARQLFREKDIDGALVGGASLNAKSFIDIVKSNHE